MNPRRTKKKGGQPSIPRTLSDGPAYSGQYKARMTLPGIPFLLSTTVTTGVIASVTNLQVYENGGFGVQGFTTRFGSTFDEYRILGANVKVRPVSASTGVSVMSFDEKSSSAPTANSAMERVGLRLPNTNANNKSCVVMRWRARDLLDLQYTAIGTLVTPCYFKVYTDLATWGAPAAVTPLWLVEPEFLVEFRGLKST